MEDHRRAECLGACVGGNWSGIRGCLLRCGDSSRDSSVQKSFGRMKATHFSDLKLQTAVRGR